MTTTHAVPISQNWTRQESTAPTATAREVNALLARREVVDIGPELVPHLAATAAELALVSGIRWRFSVDDAPVALLRMIAKVAITQPDACGPHTARLHARLVAE